MSFDEEKKKHSKNGSANPTFVNDDGSIVKVWSASNGTKESSENGIHKVGESPYTNNGVSIQERRLSIEKGEQKRDQWDQPVEFLLSCISMSVGLGNIWRFPYIAYENGGGAFLIPYLLVLTFIGRPSYFVELLVGQFSHKNAINIWDSVPCLRGIGYGQAIATMAIISYYSTLIMLGIHYVISSFNSVLPWTKCDPNLSFNLSRICVPIGSSSVGIIKNLTDQGVITPNVTEYKTIGSAEEYFLYTVLKEKSSIEDGVGYPDLQLAGTLFAVYVIFYFSLYKGVRSSGKVSYFTAIFPYVVLITFCIRGMTLDGAVDGFLFYITPKWDRLLEPEVWYNAVGQSFFSLSLSQAALPAMASYNKFRHNCYRDAWVVSIIDTFTSFISGIAIFSVLGNLSFELGEPIEKVVSSGTSLAFISYATAIAKFQYLPQLFSVLFFLMLIVLGLGSINGLATGILGIVSDAFPQFSKFVWTGVIVIVLYSIGLSYITPGGQHILAIVDSYAGTLIVFTFGTLQAIGLGYGYGVKRLVADTKFMLGIDIGFYWKFCWYLTCPVVQTIILIYQFVNWKEVEYRGPIPSYAIWIGRTIAIISIAQFIAQGLLAWKRAKKWTDIFRPNEKWGPSDPDIKEKYIEYISASSKDEMTNCTSL